MNRKDGFSCALPGCQEMMWLFGIQQFVKFLHSTLCTDIRWYAKNSKHLFGLNIKISIHPASDEWCIRNSLFGEDYHFLELVCQPDIKVALVMLACTVESSNLKTG